MRPRNSGGGGIFCLAKKEKENGWPDSQIKLGVRKIDFLCNWYFFCTISVSFVLVPNRSRASSCPGTPNSLGRGQPAAYFQAAQKSPACELNPPFGRLPCDARHRNMHVARLQPKQRVCMHAQTQRTKRERESHSLPTSQPPPRCHSQPIRSRAADGDEAAGAILRRGARSGAEAGTTPYT